VVKSIVPGIVAEKFMPMGFKEILQVIEHVYEVEVRSQLVVHSERSKAVEERREGGQIIYLPF